MKLLNLQMLEMIAIKKNIKIYGFLALVLLISSCNLKNRENHIKTNDRYHILNKVIDCVAVQVSPRSLWPASPPIKNGIKKVLTREDSLKAREDILKYINERRVIGIDTSIFKLIPTYNKLEGSSSRQYNELFDTLTDEGAIKRKMKINIGNIKLKRKPNIIFFDSITYFNPEAHLTKPRGKFNNLDYKFDFSPISYNEKKDKAAMLCTYWYKDRYPTSLLFFLNKEGSTWEINRMHSFPVF